MDNSDIIHSHVFSSFLMAMTFILHDTPCWPINGISFHTSHTFCCLLSVC